MYTTDIFFLASQLLCQTFGKLARHLSEFFLSFFNRAILHNEEDYSEPSVFRPERYLKDGLTNTSIQDPAAIVFGFGRRYVLYGPV